MSQTRRLQLQSPLFHPWPAWAMTEQSHPPPVVTDSQTQTNGDCTKARPWERQAPGRGGGGGAPQGKGLASATASVQGRRFPRCIKIQMCKTDSPLNVLRRFLLSTGLASGDRGLLKSAASLESLDAREREPLAEPGRLEEEPPPAECVMPSTHDKDRKT